MEYRVTRFCCRSGMCLECRAVANGTKRKRLVHADHLTLEMAKLMLAGWRDFEPELEPMTSFPKGALRAEEPTR